MTRKHFEQIAHALRATRTDIEGKTPSQIKQYHDWGNLCRDIADICAADNPSFRRITFLTACGL